MRKIHQKRIDALLNSNGLKRAQVPADGNCFSEAIVKQLDILDDVDTVRKNTCEQMITHINHYLGFVQAETPTLQGQMDNFSRDIDILFNSGQIKHNKTPDVDLQHVRSHIESFPDMESHYPRKESNRKFLSSNLNIRRMYDLYVEVCQQRGRRADNHRKYRQIFCDEYNLSFHVPKKRSVHVLQQLP